MFLMDEFYSHYMYEPKSAGDARPFRTLSSAEFVEDVEKDPVCIVSRRRRRGVSRRRRGRGSSRGGFAARSRRRRGRRPRRGSFFASTPAQVNGFTKNWRLPGFRVCWVVGPKHCIDVLGSIGSFMDGGANNPLQKAAIPLLDPEFVEKDALALQAHFRAKRDYMINELEKMGIKAQRPKGGLPQSTFYLWADVSALPPPLSNGVIFFEYRRGVEVSPGESLFSAVAAPRNIHFHAAAPASTRSRRSSRGVAAIRWP